MNLRDYAHYYIGAPCFNTWFTPDHDAYDAGWKLVGFRTDSEKCYLLENETDVTWTDSVMLKLRPLSSITDTQAIAIANMAMFDKMPGYPVSDYTVRRWGLPNYPPNTCQVEINNDWYELVIAIGFNTGNVWYTKGEQRVFNQPAIFHYILAQGFDIFGLIEKGEAVERK